MKRTIFYMFFFVIVSGTAFMVLNVSFTKKDEFVFRCNPKAMEYVLLEKKGEVLSIRRNMNEEGPAWFVKEGDVEAPANPSSVEAINSYICAIPYVERYEKNELSPDATGFGDKLEFKVSGDEAKTVRLGNSTPAGTEFYLSYSGSPEYIYTVPNSRDVLQKVSLMDVHSRQVLFLDPQDTLEFELAGGTIIDAETSGTVLEQVLSLRYTNFFGPFDENAADLDDYGFFEPDLTIIIKHGEKTARYLLSHYGSYYYLLYPLSPDIRFVLILDPRAPASLFETLSKTVLN